MHPWHDIDPSFDGEKSFHAVIEIPKGSKNKYELEKKSGLLIVDRVLYSSVMYPSNYGFIPQSYCEDGDPLDVLVLGQEPIHPLTIVRCRAVGMMRMFDEGKTDDKILAVNVTDPEFSPYHSISDLPPHRLKELKRFFQDYKVLENKTVTVEDFFPATQAIRVLRKAFEDYKKTRAAQTSKRRR